MTELICLLLFPALMAFAAASDLVTMTISNRISLALVAGFVVLAVATGMPVGTIAQNAGLALVALAIGFAFFARGWIGGGDAKLAAATVLWFGADQSVVYLIYAALFGGALTLALLQFRAVTLPLALTRQEWVMRLHEPRGGVPYGIALAAAALVVYPDQAFMKLVGG